jgi:uncharacterized integral membrane protein
MAGVLACVVLAFLNTTVVPVHYGFGATEQPLAIVVFWAVALGIFISILILGIPLIQSKLAYFRLSRRCRKLETQLLEKG